MNVSALADHIKENHNDKFIIAQRIKPGFDNKNLIDELKANNPAFIGVLPEITKFYENISKAEKEAEQKLIKKAKPANAAEEKIKAASEKKAAKELEESIRVKKSRRKSGRRSEKKRSIKRRTAY
jgi:PleD family two-component response regulator